jgi:hypothetical protein
MPPTVANDYQKRISPVLSPAIAVMAQPPEQLAHRSDRHPLSGRLPPPECRVRDSVAEAEVRKASPTDKDAEDRTGLASGGACRLLIVNCLFQQHPEGREVVIVRAGVVLPSVYERDQNHVLPP